jgi:hydroxyacylglutathione hydrolase
MIIKKLVVGPLENNCFIIADEKTKECFIVDPGDEPDRILDLIEENDFQVKYIVCTHAHFDHIAAVSEIKEATGAKILLHRDEAGIYRSAKDHARLWGFELDSPPEPDLFVSEGDKVEVGNLRFEVLHVPGHSPGGICLYGEGIVITGDTLFAGSVGRTDLPGGSSKNLKQSFRRLMTLADGVCVLPGHGPESTIGRERGDNFFISEI